MAEEYNPNEIVVIITADGGRTELTLEKARILDPIDGMYTSLFPEQKTLSRDDKSKPIEFPLNTGRKIYMDFYIKWLDYAMPYIKEERQSIVDKRNQIIEKYRREEECFVESHRGMASDLFDKELDKIEAKKKEELKNIPEKVQHQIENKAEIYDLQYIFDTLKTEAGGNEEKYHDEIGKLFSFLDLMDGGHIYVH